MRTFQRPEVENTIPASPRAKRLPQGSATKVALRQVRLDLNVTQVELARLASLPEAELERLEQHEFALADQLAAYAQALGGELEVAIVFGNKRYPIDMSPEAARNAATEQASAWAELDDPFPEPAAEVSKLELHGLPRPKGE